MFSEVWDRVIQTFKDMVEQLDDLAHRFDSMLNEESEIWKLHRCRICGRTFYTSIEAQKCVERHRERNARSSFHSRNKKPVKYCGKHIAPRNRESTMRSTELRREFSKGGK